MKQWLCMTPFDPASRAQFTRHRRAPIATLARRDHLGPAAVTPAEDAAVPPFFRYGLALGPSTRTQARREFEVIGATGTCPAQMDTTWRRSASKLRALLQISISISLECAGVKEDAGQTFTVISSEKVNVRSARHLPLKTVARTRSPRQPLQLVHARALARAIYAGFGTGTTLART
jgi:hypothetical protein